MAMICSTSTSSPVVASPFHPALVAARLGRREGPQRRLALAQLLVARREGPQRRLALALLLVARLGRHLAQVARRGRHLAQVARHGFLVGLAAVNLGQLAGLVTEALAWRQL
jgi:hypothetical protein